MYFNLSRGTTRASEYWVFSIGPMIEALCFQEELTTESFVTWFAPALLFFQLSFMYLPQQAYIQSLKVPKQVDMAIHRKCWKEFPLKLSLKLIIDNMNIPSTFIIRPNRVMIKVGSVLYKVINTKAFLKHLPPNWSELIMFHRTYTPKKTLCPLFTLKFCCWLSH